MFDAADGPATPRSASGATGAQRGLIGLDGDTGGGAREPPRAPAATDPLWAHLGHELRTPLHAILGNVELLVDGTAGPLSADARACLGDVQNAGRQLLRQVDLMLLLVQAEAAPGPGAEDEVDLLERMRMVMHRQVARPAVAPPGGSLVLKGDSFWLDTWVSALLEAWFGGASGSAAGRVDIGRVADPTPHEVGLRIACSAGTPPPSPVVSMLINAIVRLHGGRILPEAGGGVCLAWPKSRLVRWQTG